MEDDIERLLREVEGLDKAKPAAAAPSQPPVKAESGRSRRGVWVLTAAAGAGLVGLILGTLLGFLPWISSMSTAVGAALGGAVVAFLGRPPGWLGSEDSAGS